MNYDDENKDEYEDNEDYDDYFGEIMRRRRARQRLDSVENHTSEYHRHSSGKSGGIVYGGMTRGRNDDLQSHYTPRNPARKRRRKPSGSDLVKRRPTNSGVRKSPAQSAHYGVSRLQKYSFPVKSGTVVVAAVCLIVVVTVFASMVYSSKSIFSDDGANGSNDTMIQERLITSKENKDKVTYFLVVGVDKSTKLTDCIWVMCFDNQAHKMNVMQIPRDTYVGSNSKSPHKINGVYDNPKTVNWCSSCNRAVKQSELSNLIHTECGTKVGKKTESNISSLIRCINNRLGLPVDHYVLFDFEGFENVVDAMGGVDITLDKSLRVYPNKKEYVTLPAGENHLDGEMALKFMRNRQAYVEGDLGRVKAQRKIIHAMMEKVTDMSAVEVLSVLKSAYGNFKTDMSLEDIRSFISPIKKCGADALNMFEMPGESHWVKPNPSYYICDEEKTLEAINTYLMPYGDKLTADDINFPTLVE